MRNLPSNGLSHMAFTVENNLVTFSFIYLSLSRFDPTFRRDKPAFRAKCSLFQDQLARALREVIPVLHRRRTVDVDVLDPLRSEIGDGGIHFDARIVEHRDVRVIARRKRAALLH